MKFVPFLSLIMVFLAVPAVAQNIPEQWLQCENNEQCAATYNCVDIAVNKKYLDQITPAQACRASIQHDPNAIAKCVASACTLEFPDAQIRKNAE